MIPTEQRIIVILQSKQKNLVNVEKWLNADKLSLNLEKSCQMNIKIGNSASNVNRFSVFKLNSVFITESESCKYHGVRLDFKKMKFTEHIAEVKKKLAMQWGIVSKLRRYVPKSVLLIRLVFYSSNIKPIIQYGVLIYGCVSFTALQSLVLLQKKTLRLIFLWKYKVLTAHELHIYALLKFVMKSINKIHTDTYLNELFRLNPGQTIQQEDLWNGCWKY